MKYNLSNIMKRAWEIKRQDSENIFGLCLKMAWDEAKNASIVGRWHVRLTVKSWVIDKAQQTARAYNCYIDYAERNEDGTRWEQNGYTKVTAEEVLGETEKALKVRLRTGDVVGSAKGWTMWIPKSQIAA